MAVATNVVLAHLHSAGYGHCHCDCLLLFFVSLLSTLLVDRQHDSIAVLRSRGASRRQIPGAQLIQNIGLGIIALLVGLPLATFTVLIFSQHMLPEIEQDALKIITNAPLPFAFKRGNLPPLDTYGKMKREND